MPWLLQLSALKYRWEHLSCGCLCSFRFCSLTPDEILLTWSFFHSYFNLWLSFPFKHLHMSVSRFFSHSCRDCSLFFLEVTRHAVPVQYLTNFWRVYTLKTSLFFQLLKNHNIYLLNLNQLPFQMFHTANLVNYLAFCNAVVDNWASVCDGGVGGRGEAGGM